MVQTFPVPSKNEPFQIGMLIFPGMTNLDFAAPLDVFGHMPNTRIRR